MRKEIIICLFIITLIIIVNTITQNYTKVCVNKMNEKIDAINQIVYNQVNLQQASDEKEKGEGSKTNKKMVQDEINNLESTWNEFQEKLAYYIEHDELEKVTEAIIKSKSNIDTGDEGQAIENIDNCIFLLDHIKEKEKFNLRNIF